MSNSIRRSDDHSLDHYVKFLQEKGVKQESGLRLQSDPTSKNVVGDASDTPSFYTGGITLSLAPARPRHEDGSLRISHTRSSNIRNSDKDSTASAEGHGAASKFTRIASASDLASAGAESVRMAQAISFRKQNGHWPWYASAEAENAQDPNEGSALGAGE